MGLLTDRDLLDVLFDLNSRLNTYGGKVPGTNVVERYMHFVTHTEAGKNCSYARKYRDLFMESEYEDIRKLIIEAAEHIRNIESGVVSDKGETNHED